MKKKIGIIIIMIALCFPIMIYAKTENNIYAEEEINISEDIDATSFIAGNNVEVSSSVNGLSFVAGNNIEISNTQDYLFAAGNIITLDKVTSKDTFIAGSNIRVKESNIRDLYAAGASVKVDSNIERNVYIGGEKVTINGVIGGNAKIEATTIVIGKDTVINGTLSYPQNANITIANEASIEMTKTYEATNVEVKVPWKNLILEKITSYLSLLLIALLMIFLDKHILKAIKGEKKDLLSALKNAGKGFIILVMSPVIILISMITIIGLPLGIIMALVYGIAIYLSMIPTSIFVGNWIFKKKFNNDYLLVTISLLIVYIMHLLPIIGGLVSFVSLILGLGLFANITYNHFKTIKK